MHGEETLPLQGFRTFNVRQPEDVLLRSILQMAQAGHQRRPRPVLEAQGEMQRTSPLTPRETEVLRLVVSGLLNKEIANRLGVSLTTVISHRKNLTAKIRFCAHHLCRHARHSCCGRNLTLVFVDRFLASSLLLTLLLRSARGGRTSHFSVPDVEVARIFPFSVDAETHF